MNILTANLATEFDILEVQVFADEHVGDKHADLQGLEARIEYVKNTPNCFAILNGDIIDNATTTSVGDTYGATMSPEQQVEYASDVFSPIANKILAVNDGNHEYRTYKKEGLAPSKIIANNLGIVKKFSNTGTLLVVTFGCNPLTEKPMLYSFYATHGSGGGRKEGAKIIRLTELASIVDTDIYIHSHSHLPITTKEDFVRVNHETGATEMITKLFINSAANLRYGGYGEVIGCKPASLDKHKIYLSGTTKKAYAIL